MNIGIIGLGLIGGSLARSIVKNTNHIVYGYDINIDVMKKAEMLNAYHYALGDDEYSKLDMLILALNPSIECEVLKNIVSKLSDGCIVVDCAGNKRNIVATMKELQNKFSNIFFIGGHPMAGKENSGIKYSSPLLFNNASMILTPVTMDIVKMSLVKELFLQLGFKEVVLTDAENHDKMIAFTSQLAHIISSAYVLNPNADKHKGYSAGSFKDMTRVAKLNPDMWTELLMQNRDNLINEIATIVQTLIKYQDALKNENTELLHTLLASGNERKINLDK